MAAGTFKALNRVVGKALHRYEMLADGDRVLIGVSGGMDSLTLMWILQERRARVPIGYDIFPVYIDPGFGDGFNDQLAGFCASQGLALRVERTDCGPRGHSPENRENPCFLCSRLRRKRLFEVADEMGCNKLALGHNKDDIIETFFLNICYAGEISTMQPLQPFFDGRFEVIRPLAFAAEDLIRRFARRRAFPTFETNCPSARTSRRREIKGLLDHLYRSNRKIKGNIFRAMHHVRSEYLLKPPPEDRSRTADGS
ncbi:MAG: ATP-binding protein [Desulfobacterales bacterium]